jgi:hypothetical protein
MQNNLSELISRLIPVIPYCVVLVILLIVSWFVLRLIRVQQSKTELRPTDYLESFQKLHEEGKLTEEEFRIVRRLLSLQPARSPDQPQNSPMADFPLLNQNSPSLSTDSPSGNIPKK